MYPFSDLDYPDFSLKKPAKSKFKTVSISYRAKIFEDHPKFKFSNILKNKNFFRGVKRFLSNYVLYTAYFSCKK